MASSSSQTSSRVEDTVKSSVNGTTPSVPHVQRDSSSNSTVNNSLDHDKEPASVARTTTRRAGRKSEYWSTEQLALLGKHTARFLACVEENKVDLKDLFVEEKMRMHLEEGIRKATSEGSLSREDLDYNHQQETTNKLTWKQANFYKNKLRDYRKEHSSEGVKVGKDDSSAYELLQKVLFTSFGPRDLFAQENAAEIRKCRDELVAQKPELQSNNGAPYQLAISQLWAAADQASYTARAKDQSMNLDRDEDKLSKALHWFLNALSPKLGEVEMKLIYALRHNGGGISVRSVDAACKSRTNFDDKFETDHEESWSLFSNAFLQWADKRIPHHVPQGHKAASDIPTNLEGIPVFPEETSSDPTITVMRDTLNAYFKAVWFHSWPADLQMAALPWSEVEKHPEDYYSLNQFPEGGKLRSPDSMKKADLATWFEYFEERPRNTPPFVFFPKAEIEGRLRMRQLQALEELHAGEEFVDDEDESAPRSSSPALEVIMNTELAPTATPSVIPSINGPLDSSKSTSTSMSTDNTQGVTPTLKTPSPSSSMSHNSGTHVSHHTTVSSPNPTTSISAIGDDKENPAPVIAFPSSLEAANTTAISVLGSQSTSTFTVPNDTATSSVGSSPFSSTPNGRTTAVSNTIEEDSLPPAHAIISQQTVQKHVGQPSLTIKVPPASKGPINGQGATAEMSLEDIEDQAARKKEVKGKVRKGKGRAKNPVGNPDQPREGEVVGDRIAQAGGSRRKRKVDSVEEAEVQANQKRAQATGISAAGIRTLAQPAVVIIVSVAIDLQLTRLDHEVKGE
ncbi:hypothetical protein VKT23_019208 [Stygiomarasmius scandens]|uniref:Uncharacterized protein n=1 Tax=Marasmiellus scandens TaxID=2682957 RepID=A0ABR1IRD5_9AGAR